MNAILKRRKVTEAYLRIVGKPKHKWTVENRWTGERRIVGFSRAVYYWIVCNLKGRFPSVVGE